MDKLTPDQESVRALAREHYKMDVQDIIGHAIAGSEQPQVYFVVGSFSEWCDNCNTHHKKSEYLVFLRIEDGFILLSDKTSVSLHEDVPPWLTKLLSMDSEQGLEK